jgi:hypothetical protein
MSNTSKSPRKVIIVALAAGRDALPDFSSRFSPRAFTQPQLFACLVLKTFFNLDYRGLEALLVDSPDLVETLGLRQIPDHSTIQKAHKRLLKQPQVQRLLESSIGLASDAKKND